VCGVAESHRRENKAHDPSLHVQEFWRGMVYVPNLAFSGRECEVSIVRTTILLDAICYVLEAINAHSYPMRQALHGQDG